MVDPERGKLVTRAFAYFATGRYSLDELADVLEGDGLRTRPLRGQPGKALDAHRLERLLRDPYYIGVVRHAGVVAKGVHRPLTDRSTFRAVRHLLDSRGRARENGGDNRRLKTIKRHTD